MKKKIMYYTFDRKERCIAAVIASDRNETCAVIMDFYFSSNASLLISRCLFVPSVILTIRSINCAYSSIQFSSTRTRTEWQWNPMMHHQEMMLNIRSKGATIEKNRWQSEETRTKNHHIREHSAWRVDRNVCQLFFFLCSFVSGNCQMMLTKF